jgi:hypothetical protein
VISAHASTAVPEAAVPAAGIAVDVAVDIAVDVAVDIAVDVAVDCPFGGTTPMTGVGVGVNEFDGRPPQAEAPRVITHTRAINQVFLPTLLGMSKNFLNMLFS